MAPRALPDAPRVRESQSDRFAMRTRSPVWAVKRRYEYTTAWTAQVPRPRTPDPKDRHLNKRPWEDGVQQWRISLKDVVSKLPPERKIVSELLANIFDHVFDDVFKSRKSRVQWQ